MTKRDIRNVVGDLNRSIGLGERTEEAHNIFNIIEIDQKFTDSNSIALFVSLPDEVPTLNIIERWHEMGKQIALPRVRGERMEFVAYSPGELQSGAFGIMEPSGESIVAPSEIELMIVPGVAFCSDGRRLGRGCGYYDRYLSQHDFRGYTIGIGYSHQLVDNIPCEAHDIPLSKIITPTINPNSSTLSNVIIKIIDTAADAAKGLGCGIEGLISRGVTWVLSRLSVVMFEQPTSLENVEIETWIEDCRRIATTRNFILTNGDGERIGVATSQWCMIDMVARRPIDLTRAEFNYTRHIEPRNEDIERAGKIPQIDSFDGELSISHHTVNELDIDINNHMNTMRYIEMMLAMIDREHRNRYAPIKVDLHFVNESLKGEHLTIMKKEQPLPSGRELLFEIIRADNTPSVRALFSYRS